MLDGLNTNIGETESKIPDTGGDCYCSWCKNW